MAGEETNMAFAATTAGSGDTWSNVFTDETLRNFQYGQTAAPTLSSNSLELTYTFGPEVVKLLSTAGFGLSQRSGIVNGFVSGDTTISGLAVGYENFNVLVRDGDNEALNLALWSGNDTITGGASADTIRGFGGIDILRGNDGNDSLTGDAGNDRLFGGNGSDFLKGGIGNDQLDGGAGNDQLTAGAGNDLLIGGAGLDNMTGGSGADTFRFNGANDLFVSGANPFATDFIRDFIASEGDKIDIDKVDANSTLVGNQDFTYIGAAAFGTNTPGQVRVVSLGGPFIWQVLLNTDNDAALEYAIAVVSFSGQPLAADFLL
jgi:Ca2+-binding RTX toxin-like protein